MDADIYDRELRRAQTRTDIFRVLRMACELFSVESFVLLDFEAALAGSLEKSIIFDSFSQIRMTSFLSEHEAFARLENLTTARFNCWSADDQQTASPLGMFDAQNAVWLTITTKAGSSLLLILINCKSYSSGLGFTSQMLEFHTILARYVELSVTKSAMTSLTEREIEIARWTARGKTSAEIAVMLGLSQYAINEQISEAMKKVDAVNRIQFVAKSIRLGLI